MQYIHGFYPETYKARLRIYLDRRRKQTPDAAGQLGCGLMPQPVTVSG